MTKTSFDIDDLVIRYLAGETTSYENQLLSSWLSESTENRSYFNTLRNIWLVSSQVTTPEMAMRNLTTEFRPDPGADKYSRIFSMNNTLLWKVAAILVIALLSGILIFKQSGTGSNNLKSYLITVEATLGSRASTTLPDGTKVWLNSGSKIYYNSNYNLQSRDVKLVGEGYFDVVTNPEKPFVVKTGKLNIKAYGTVFNVKAYPEDASVTTTLVEGKVIIDGLDAENKSFTVQMKPKETVKILKNEVDRAVAEDGAEDVNAVNTLGNIQGSDEASQVARFEKVNTELFTSWKDSRWVIEKQKLGDLSRDFERRYNIRIRFLSDSIKKFHFSGTLENETVEQIMTIMRHTIPLKYKIEKGVITISEDNELMNRFYK